MLHCTAALLYVVGPVDIMSGEETNLALPCLPRCYLPLGIILRSCTYLLGSTKKSEIWRRTESAGAGAGNRNLTFSSSQTPYSLRSLSLLDALVARSLQECSKTGRYSRLRHHLRFDLLLIRTLQTRRRRDLHRVISVPAEPLCPCCRAASRRIIP